MITITKQNDGVLFTFQDSDKYLYGNGSILVPFNTLSIVADESDMITLKKAASNDVFLSARYDTDLGYRSKDDAIDDLKGMLFAETGGVSSGDVETMIEASLEDYYDKDEIDAGFNDVNAAVSGKADTSTVNQIAADATAAITALSGEVQTKVNITDFNTYSAATATAINGKQDVLSAGTGIEISGNVISATGGGGSYEYYSENISEKTANINIEDTDNTITSTTTFYSDGFDIGVTSDIDGIQNIGYINGGDAGVSMGYDKMTGDDATDAHSYLYVNENNISLEVYSNEVTTTLEVNDNGVAINNDAVATEPYVDAATSGKADTTAVTAVNNILTAHTADTTIHVTTAQTEAWNAKQDALYIYTEDNNLGTAELHSNDSSIIFNAGGASITANNAMGVNTFNVASTGVTINGENVLTDGIISTAITSGSTDSEIPTAKATYDAIQAQGGGGGATYSAGTNISIDTGNTINCTLPIKTKGSISIDGGSQNSSMSNATSSISYGTSHNFALALSNGAAFGQYNVISNNAECSVGYANESKRNSSSFGYSGNTLFTVGNGGAGEQVRHNAFEVRQNGDIYFPDTDNTTYQNFNQKPMVRLQDMYGALGGLKFVQCTQAEYSAMEQAGTLDANTLYIVSNVVS